MSKTISFNNQEGNFSFYLKNELDKAFCSVIESKFKEKQTMFGSDFGVSFLVWIKQIKIETPPAFCDESMPLVTVFWVKS